MKRALLSVAPWWRGAPSQGGLTDRSTDCHSGFQLGPQTSPMCSPCPQGKLAPDAAPGSNQVPAGRYLPSVTLCQHRLLFLFPLDFMGSGKGFSALALLMDSVPKSCSQQKDRPSWV